MTTSNGYTAFIMIVCATCAFAGGGEICAVVALDHRHATPVEEAWVNGAIRVLPVITVIVLTVALFTRAGANAESD